MLPLETFRTVFSCVWFLLFGSGLFFFFPFSPPVGLQSFPLAETVVTCNAGMRQ